jgi:type IV pilus assembly protein PilV
MKRTPLTQRGASLIEVLVAMLTVAIGMLGIAGLQASSIRLAQGAAARTTAASGLADLADRVRSNPSSSNAAYAFHAATSPSAGYAEQRAALSSLASAKDCEGATACTADELAASQLVQWRLALQRDLPGGAGFVTGSRDTGYRVTVMWMDRTARNTSPACPAGADAPAGVRCASLEVRP